MVGNKSRAAAHEGYVSVELLQIERDTSDMLREQNQKLRTAREEVREENERLRTLLRVTRIRLINGVTVVPNRLELISAIDAALAKGDA